MNDGGYSDVGGGAGRERSPEVGYDTGRPVRSLYETAREVILRPRGFFGALPPEYGRGPDHPVWFAVAVGVLTAPLFLVREAFDPLVGAGENPGVLDLLRNAAEEGPGLPVAIALALFFLLISPLFVVLGLLIGSALVHVLIRLLVPQKRDYYATMKVLAYSSALGILSWIPVLGYLAMLYGYYVNYWGWRGMHRATGGRALAVVLVQALVGLGFAALSLWT